MSTGGFQRVEPLGDGFIRGPARVLVCPYTYSYPTNLNAVINLATSGYTTEVQEIKKPAEEPETGTITFGFASYETKALKPTATATEIQTALEALPSIGTGGVKVTKGPLKSEKVVITFAGELAEHAQPLIVVANNELKKGVTAVPIEIVRTTAGFGLYDPVGEWTELGATKGGVKISRNNTESMIDIDQIQAAILAIPDEWEMTIDAPLAQTSLENIQLAWEGGEIKTDVTQTPNERHIGLGNPSAYVERRMAIVHKKTVGTAAGKIRAHVFRRVLRSPSNSSIEFMKNSIQQILPLTFRAFADPIVADPKYSMGEVIDQSAYV